MFEGYKPDSFQLDMCSMGSQDNKVGYFPILDYPLTGEAYRPTPVYVPASDETKAAIAQANAHAVERKRERERKARQLPSDVAVLQETVRALAAQVQDLTNEVLHMRAYMEDNSESDDDKPVVDDGPGVPACPMVGCRQPLVVGCSYCAWHLDDH